MVRIPKTSVVCVNYRSSLLDVSILLNSGTIGHHNILPCLPTTTTSLNLIFREFKILELRLLIY